MSKRLPDRGMLTIGDMKVYGVIYTYPDGVKFEGQRFKLKRKLKSNPIDIAMRRIKRGVECKVLGRDGTPLEANTLVAYGFLVRDAYRGGYTESWLWVSFGG